jgi:hypothetical protein
MFEKMSEPRTAFALVSGTDIVVDGDGNDRYGHIPIKDDPQAVFQFIIFYLE